MPEATSIKIKRNGYVDEYPQFSKIADDQIKVFWPWNEIDVSKDKQDLLIGTSESDVHRLITTLKLFTIYECFVGEEQWGGRIAKAYPHVGPVRMAAAFAHVELNSHAPFYDEINKVMGLSDYAFYNSYLEDPVLKARVDFIESLIANKDDELSTAVFSAVEGAILYTSFYELKKFQSRGNNKAPNLVRGINMSVRDENLHSIGGAGLVNVALAEQRRSSYEMAQFQEAVTSAIEALFMHECHIADKMHELDPEGASKAKETKEFAKHRLNLMLSNLNLKPIYTIGDEYDFSWFYKGINNYQMNDFFQGVGREYQRDWSPKRFVWKKD
jgi:ribonucleoside-diphosphate reductase beta chain